MYVVGTGGIVTHYGFWNNPDRTRAAINAVLAANSLAANAVQTTSPCPSLHDDAGLDDATIKRMIAGILRLGGPDTLMDFMVNSRDADFSTTPNKCWFN